MVLEFLARGYRRGEIAAALGVSLPTVNAHLGGISAKFQARCRLNAGGDPRRPAASAPAARPAGPAGGNSVRTAPGFLSINELAGSRTVTIAG
jgi:hypothetical protein